MPIRCIREAVTSAPRSTTTSRCATRCSCTSDYYVTESSGHNSEYNCVVPQAARPHREILHPRHRLESRPTMPTSSTQYLGARRPRGGGDRSWLDRAEVDLERGRRVRHLHLQRHHRRRDACSSSTAMCATSASSTTCPKAAASRCPCSPRKRGLKPMHVGPLPDAARGLTNGQRPVRGAGGRGLARGRPSQGVPRDVLRSADQRRA